MEITAIENLKLVHSSNQEMLDYFNDEYVEKLKQFQNLTTEQFELNVRIDELEKTLEVYSFKNSSGHNVFSPFSTSTTSQQDKSSQIEGQLHDLKESRISIDSKITVLQKDIEMLKHRLNLLTNANHSLDKMLEELCAEEAAAEAEDMENEPGNDSENDLDEDVDNNIPMINHGINILRLQKYDKDNMAKKISSTIKELADSNNHKLESLSWLIKSDINRAKVTLSEIKDTNVALSKAVETIITNLDNNIDTEESICTLLDDTILEYKDKHPECVIESDIDCQEEEPFIPEIITINLIYIIRELLDNAFKHSNASRIIINIFVSEKLIDVSINDNGVGIDSNYNHLSPWYSGLHRIQEIIHLLNGQIKIEGDIINGTTVHFAFLVDDTQ
jgi:two-component system sensor histidine kinase DegS